MKLTRRERRAENALRDVVDAAHQMLMEMQNAVNSPRIEYWNERIVQIAHKALETNHMKGKHATYQA